jgi:CheY-like chemotaxis protein
VYRSTILLVEDHIDSLAAFTLLLKRRGYDVVPFRDLIEAAEFGKQAHFDLLVCGIRSPDASTPARLLHELRALRDFPAIALTSFGYAEDVQKAFEVGFDHVLIKPLGVRELLDAISDCVDNSGTAPRSGE